MHWPGHDDHYDLLLQFSAGVNDNDRVLKTFASVHDLPPWDILSDAQWSLRADHKKLYLRYEGDIPDNRGRVVRVDEGDLRWVKSYDENNVQEFRIYLTGKCMQGEYHLLRNEGRQYTLQKVGANR